MDVARTCSDMSVRLYTTGTWQIVVVMDFGGFVGL